MTLDNVAPLGIAILGLVLGVRHATDADHVIAVTTIVSRERHLGAAAKVGLVWGLGHSLTVMLVGGAIIVFKLTVPVRLGLMMEFAVALVLIVLGLSTMNGIVRQAIERLAGRPTHPSAGLAVHTHPHAHEGSIHHHVHVHPYDAGTGGGLKALHHDHRLPSSDMLRVRRPLATAFGVGLVHGLAGSAAIALLVLSAIPQAAWGVLYLGVFGAGTMLGMGMITTAVGVPFLVGGQKMARFHGMLTVGSGVLSFAFGLILAYQIGVAGGLFGAAPIWTPH